LPEGRTHRSHVLAVR
jgi:SAM-dependent methyltransferase